MPSNSVFAIRNMDAYCFIKWEQQKCTPINEKIKNSWEFRTKTWFWKRGKSPLFHRCFRLWKKGKVTPINENIQVKWESILFSEQVLESYNISKNNRGFSVHHLLPKQYFPDRSFDIENTIPLTKQVHPHLHKEYKTHQLILDPIMPVVEVLSDVFLQNQFECIEMANSK